MKDKQKKNEREISQMYSGETNKPVKNGLNAPGLSTNKAAAFYSDTGIWPFPSPAELSVYMEKTFQGVHR